MVGVKLNFPLKDLFQYLPTIKKSRQCSHAISLVFMVIAVSFVQCTLCSSSESLQGSPGELATFDNSHSTEAPASYEDDYYSSGENETSWKDGNWRRKDNSKIAQVVVYFSVILIALAGVLIKYFVTQYETSQLKAQEQLDYQRLQNA